MIGFTIAIGDFMAMLVSSALWIAAGFVAELLIGIGLVGGGVLLVRRMWRCRHP